MTPLSMMRTILPVVSVPTVNSPSKMSHGFSEICLWPSEIRRCSLSIDNTTTSSSSPFFTNSPGWRIFLVQLRSEMCTRPSTPGSSSTNTPKLVRLRTAPLCVELSGYLAVRSCHGSGSSCFIPRASLRSVLSMFNTTALTICPSETVCDGCLMCCVQLISLM